MSGLSGLHFVSFFLFIVLYEKSPLWWTTTKKEEKTPWFSLKIDTLQCGHFPSPMFIWITTFTDEAHPITWWVCHLNTQCKFDLVCLHKANTVMVGSFILLSNHYPEARLAKTVSLFIICYDHFWFREERTSVCFGNENVLFGSIVATKIIVVLSLHITVI